MRKTIILIVISLTSLIIISCGIAGYTQRLIDTGPDNFSETTENSTTMDLGSLNSENPAKSQSANKPLPSKTPLPTIQIKNTPTPTINPIETAKSCLTKTWEINGLSNYVVAAVPPELAQEYSLEYVETNGQAYLTLTPNDEIVLSAEELVFLFNARFGIFKVPVTVRIDGKAEGSYDLTTSTLSSKDMDTSGLSASAKALDEDLIDPEQIIRSIPFVRPPFNTANYACQGDILEIEFTGYPGDTPPLIFQAVK